MYGQVRGNLLLQTFNVANQTFPLFDHLMKYARLVRHSLLGFAQLEYNRLCELWFFLVLGVIILLRGQRVKRVVLYGFLIVSHVEKFCVCQRFSLLNGCSSISRLPFLLSHVRNIIGWCHFRNGGRLRRRAKPDSVAPFVHDDFNWCRQIASASLTKRAASTPAHLLQ